MRISTYQLQQQTVDAMLKQQTDLAKTSLQISSGKRIVTPSDDPIAAAGALGFRDGIERVEQYQQNIIAARSRLNAEEGQLQSVIDVVQRVRELGIEAGDGTNSTRDRVALAEEVSERLKELISLANGTDGAGEYLFGGYKSRTQPFAQTATGASYSGDQGQRFLQVAENFRVAVDDPGHEVFRDVLNGNGTFATSYNAANTGSGLISPGTVTDPSVWVDDTHTITFTTATTYEVRDSALALVTSGTYVDGGAISFLGAEVSISGTPANGDGFTVASSQKQDLFTSVQNLVNALNRGITDDESRAEANMDTNAALQAIDQALENVSNIRAKIGARLNAIESQEFSNTDFLFTMKEALSNIEDLDYAEAVSRFDRQLLAYQTSQQAYVRMQNLSLFNYIGA